MPGRLNNGDTVMPITVVPNLANATSLREFDYIAYRDPEIKPYGYGRSPGDAIEDLLNREKESKQC